MEVYKYSLGLNDKKVTEEKLEGKYSLLGTYLFLYNEEEGAYFNLGKLNSIIVYETENDMVASAYSLVPLENDKKGTLVLAMENILKSK